MPQRLVPNLSNEEYQQLNDLLKKAPKHYLRERAAAILKLAESNPICDIADSGLLQKRARQTVSIWFHNFQEKGIEGLYRQAGSGRKPAFSPSA